MGIPQAGRRGPSPFFSFRKIQLSWEDSGGLIALESFERVLWWLFGGSTGAVMRARILLAVREQPRNAQQLTKALGVDYTTVRHHLRVLLKNGLVVTAGEGYGKMYFVSNSMEAHWGNLVAILVKTGRTTLGATGHDGS